MKNFDDIFSRKVKEAFENYNADHLAKEGWNAYVNKYGRRRSRVIFFPLWARAASIIILVTAGVLFINRLNHREGDESVGRLAQETLSEKADTLITAPTTDITAPEPETLASTRKNTTRISSTRGTGQNAVAAAGRAGQHRQSDREKAGYQGSEAAKPVLAESDMYQESISHQTTTAMATSSLVNLPADPIGIRVTDDADTRLNLKPKIPIKDYSDLPRERMTTTIMTGLSGMMASIDNTTSASQGISIGFYVEQQLSRRISVRPGLAMARHNYTMESMSGGSLDMVYSAPELNGLSGTTTSYEADIDVVSMEVPVNFVFSLRKRNRSNLFVSTGASTVIYLSQHLTGNFNNTYTRSTVDSYGEVSYEYMTTSVKIEKDQELLNRVDLLGLANFSAGYSFPFAGTSQLLFEPFIQLPIRDLTSLNLRIRYGGVSMKIKF